MCNNLIRISIVSAYQSQVRMTCDFLDNLAATSCGEYVVEMVLVNAGCATKIRHPFISRRVDLPENISFSNSMNAGIRATHGEYIVVMNNDAFPRPGWIDTLIRYQNETDAWLVSPEVSSPRLIEHFVLAKHEGYAEVSMYPAVCWMLPRLTVNLVGYFDERFVPTMWEDNDYAKRVLNEGGKFIVVTDCQVEHRRSKENNANFEGRISSIYAVNQRRFYEKWGHKP